jgi:hypothetical protein
MELLHTRMGRVIRSENNDETHLVTSIGMYVNIFLLLVITNLGDDM